MKKKKYLLRHTNIEHTYIFTNICILKPKMLNQCKNSTKQPFSNTASRKSRTSVEKIHCSIVQSKNEKCGRSLDRFVFQMFYNAPPK